VRLHGRIGSDADYVRDVPAGQRVAEGLMLDGRRKSIEAMAERLPDGNEQNLQQFVPTAAPKSETHQSY
jgi:hypothetical protein